MRQIGIVKHVQIQRASLKLGARPNRIYNPAPLLQVPGLWVSSDGVFGQMPDDAWMIDVHHAHHPATRNNRDNGVSFSFTPHYTAMREQFGAHLLDGCAGENILIESDKSYHRADLGKRVAFQASSSDELIYLDEVRVAVPCIEFTHYVHQTDLVSRPLPAESVKSTLQFLDEGRRGFYARALQPGVVLPGSAVFVVD